MLNDTLGHRGRKDDPLYRGRCLLTKGHERLDVVRSIYDIEEPADADPFVGQLAIDLQDESCPPEVRQLGRTPVNACRSRSRRVVARARVLTPC